MDEIADSTKRILHVEETIDLWGQAEDELRKGNDEKCLELKEEFQTRYKTYTKEEQQYINDYIESVGW